MQTGLIERTSRNPPQEKIEYKPMNNQYKRRNNQYKLREKNQHTRNSYQQSRDKWYKNVCISCGLIDRKVYTFYKENHKCADNYFLRGPDYINDKEVRKKVN